MRAVFVHGVPDTHRMWQPLLAALGSTEDLIALALPGFDAPVPDGFEATKDAYAEWVTSAIEAIGEPVHLVGHDWGSLLVQRVASTRPDLVQTWAALSAFVDPAYVWHDLAQAFQTPEVGEQIMEGFVAEALPDALAESGLPPEAIVEIGTHLDPTMKTCILRLYRSAIDFGEDWSPAIDATRGQRPMVAIVGDSDPYVPAEFAGRLAERAGGRAHVLAETGHWVPVQRPEAVAAILTDLWPSTRRG